MSKVGFVISHIFWSNDKEMTQNFEHYLCRYWAHPKRPLDRIAQLQPKQDYFVTMSKTPYYRLLSAFLALCYLHLGGCAANPTSSEAKADASTTNLYDQYMAEERAWAGLTTNTLAVRKNLDIVYSEGGKRGAPVLILLHGYYGDRNNWNRVAYQLRDRFHLIIPDLPGHGDSSVHPEADYTFAETSFVLSDFIDQLKIRRFNLAGHSMGGGIAIQWAMSRGKQIDRMILVDSAGKYPGNTSVIARQMMDGANPMRIAQPGDARRVLSMAMSLPPFVPHQVMNDFETKQLKRTAVYDEVMADMLARDKSLDVRFFNAALRLFKMPVLILWGDQDAIFSVDVTKQYMEKLVILEGVGHTPILEAPWPTAKAMASFLTE